MNPRIEIVETQNGEFEYIKDNLTAETIDIDGMYMLEENVNKMHKTIFTLAKLCQENNISLEVLETIAPEYYEEIVGEIEDVGLGYQL